MDKQLWVTQYNPEEKHPEGKYPNRSDKDSGLGQFTQDNHSIENTDDVVWLLKLWNFFDETPTLNLNAPK
jgi:primary-amine oxidase